MTGVPFTRPTIDAAVVFLVKLNQAPFNRMVLRLGLENEITADTAISVAEKADMLGRIVVQRPDDPVDTWKVRCRLPKWLFVKPSSSCGQNLSTNLRLR
jgi:hypothetical protein